MDLSEKINAILDKITQLPEYAQVEVVEALVSMRCAQLGIYPTDDETPAMA